MNLHFLFKVQLFTSFYMMGIIWLVQIIHYPLFKLVGPENWSKYHSQHIKLTSMVIAGPMILELLSLAILFYLSPSYLNNNLMITSALLLIIIWVTTFFVSVPAHNQLAIKFNEKSWKKLVQTNWIRTISWTLKSFILLYLLNLNLKP
jgi:hypothetical protein